MGEIVIEIDLKILYIMTAKNLNYL